MRQNRISKWVVGVVVAAGAMVAGMGTAQAVVYRGSWDPLFGLSLPELVWTGTVEFNLPDTCLAKGVGTWAISSDGCAGESILNATVNFYDKDDLATKLGSLDFGSSNGEWTISMRVAENGETHVNELAGVTGTFLVPVETDVGIAGYQYGAWHSVFYLGFDDTNGSPITLRNCRYAWDSSPSCATSANSVASFDSLTPVPEADGYVLALAGLGVVGAAMTRRRRSAPQSAARS